MENKKEKGSALKFLEGAAIGLALGVAATVFLTSEKGKKLTKDAKKMMADFYKYVSPKVKEMGKIGEKEYKKFMKASAEQYGKIKKLSKEKITQLAKEAQKSWKHFSK